MSKMLKFVLPIVRVLALVYVGLSVVLYFNQSRMVYFPRAEILSTPDSIGLAYEAIDLETADHIKLTGWFVPASGKNSLGKAVILYCHGNGGNIGTRVDYLSIFNSLGLTTFMFNYRGYGDSDGKPSETGTYTDVEAAWDYLVNVKQVPPEKILVYGESLGGGVASYIAKRKQPGGLIMASTFTSLSDRASEIYPFLPIRLLSKFSYNSLERMPEIAAPILVIHSVDDLVIPFKHGEALFAAANEPKMLVQINGDHNAGFLESLDIYRSGINGFVQTHM